jgi:hypothetical protein
VRESEFRQNTGEVERIDPRVRGQKEHRGILVLILVRGRRILG